MINEEIVVQFLGICIGPEDKIRIVMELVHHGNLQQYLRDQSVQTFNRQTLLKICIDIAAGMQHLASGSIIHGDLAARNILIVPVYTKPSSRDNLLQEQTTLVIPKITDFGLAGFMQKHSEKIPIRWASPEIIMHLPATSASDIWAFAVLMWEVFSMARSLPFASLNNAQVVHCILNGVKLQKPDCCPLEVFDVMLDCWKFNRNTRPSFSTVHKLLNHCLRSGCCFNIRDTNLYTTIVEGHVGNPLNSLPSTDIASLSAEIPMYENIGN